MECWEVILLTIAFIAAFLLLFKIYLKLTTGWNTSYTCLVGKTAIVTGSNTGIGFYTAQEFAKRGARVILACRDPKRAEDARSKIVEETGNRDVIVRIIDLSSLASVRAFAKKINETEEKIDILVNNAGVGGFYHQLTPDGLSLVMQANHFGHFLLTNLLLGLLKKSAPSRIVNVSSEAARLANLNIDDLNSPPPGSGLFRNVTDYSNTKLCNILFSNELARRLKDSRVEVYSLHPGTVQTEFLRPFPSLQKKLLQMVAKMYYKTAEEGAQTTIYAAVSKDVLGKSGEYFADCKKAQMPSAARNEKLAKKLWEKSTQFVKLNEDELN